MNKRIFGIGTDIVEVGKISDKLEHLGERFASRILMDRELGEFGSEVRPAHFLARRFAVQEAVAKALGAAFRDGLH